ncbi:2-succinyl-5-enolpyruvyl-6-hydroxy-3-cyclohexene-1-carboxylic-acid synthase, partial [Plectonema cf. radiosum LEGE 06105]
MPIGFRNINELWASIFTETLKQMGLNCAVICPGSRSTPLIVAFAVAEGIEVIPILDERSAAFFALGRAKATGLPVAVVCTSGTAGANFYSAVVEANLSRVPLLLLTADRPQELRNCHSGQTIDQLKLFGNYPNWQAELAIPSTKMEMLAYLRQTAIYAYEQTLYPVSGAVHLNIPFRDPLAPIRDENDLNVTSLHSLQSDFNSEEFFAVVTNKFKSTITHSQIPIPDKWLETKRGIIIAGVAQPQQPQKYCSAIAQLARNLKFPVLAEGLSPVRNYASLNPYMISTYDSILRNQHFATELTPEVVIQIGEMPTSKILRQWLSENNPLRWIIEPSNHNLDALHGRVVHLRMNVEEIERWWDKGMGGQGDGQNK